MSCRFALDLWKYSSGKRSQLALDLTKAKECASLWAQETQSYVYAVLTSIQPNISCRLFNLNTAKVVWECIQHVYSDSNNINHIY